MQSIAFLFRRLAVPLSLTVAAFAAGVSPLIAADDATAPEPTFVPTDLFAVPEGLEITVWATTPMLHNPTNIEIDKDGRIWVTEGVNYRSHSKRQLEGDRIVVLEDTTGSGVANKSW